MLKGKKIVIGITGSIAAYKIPLLVRLFKKSGAEVQVIMTPDAHDFVTPLTLSVLSENPIYTEPFNRKDGSWNSHVEFGTNADLMIIAPATANTIAKMSSGQADNLLLTTYLAAKCQIFIAPAMDLDMYYHPTTKHNIETLKSFNNIIIEPREGELASGLCGAGRMEEPDIIVEKIENWFKKKEQLKGKKVLISAGPTREPLDPVRYLSNYSTGTMGYELAKSFAEHGAEVLLVSGPVDISLKHNNVNIIPATTADEMYDLCNAFAPDCDIIVMTAAVADFKPLDVSQTKIKKTENDLINITLTKNKDILKTLGEKKKTNQLLIGFALETNNALDNAKKKLQNKNADFIVLNALTDNGAGFGYKTNKVTVIDKNEQITDFPVLAKSILADKLTGFFISHID